MPYARGYKSVGFASRPRRIRGEIVYAQRKRSAGLAAKRRNRMGYSSVARSRGAAVTGEMKYFDTETTTVAIVAPTTDWSTAVNDPETTINLGDAAVATPGCLFVPKVSASLNGRIGRSVKMMKVKVRGHIQVLAQSGLNTADNGAYVRLLLVMDTQTNATQMTGDQLLNGASAVNATLNSFQNPNFFGRFRVLKDKIFVLENPSLAGEVASTNVVQSGLVKPFKWSVNLRGEEVHFNATNGGTIADIVDKSLHIVAGCVSLNLVPTLSYYTRVAYKE
jgi:hypothetical protein